MRWRNFEASLSGSSAAKWVVGADFTVRNRPCTVRGERFQGEVRFAARGQVDPVVFGIRLKTVAWSECSTLGALDDWAAIPREARNPLPARRSAAAGRSLRGGGEA
jgi:hypothetical protein